MSLLGGLLRRSLEDPHQPLTSLALADWLSGGRTRAGVPVSEKRALGITAYFRGIALMSGTIGSMPLKVYRNGTREPIQQRTVLDNPNRIQTPFEFWQTMIANAVSWGNGYGRKLRNGADIVEAVWPIHPSRVRIEIVDGLDGMPDKLFIVLGKSGREYRWGTRDIMQLPYLSPDGTAGLSPMKLAREALGITVAAEDYAASFFGQGTVLSGILTTDKSIEEEDAKKLKRRWKETLTGPEHAHDIAVLDNGAKYQALTVPPNDAQLLVSRQWQVSEIARLFGIPPHLLGEVDKSTSWGRGIEQQVIGLVQFTFQSWLSMIEQRVTRELLPGGWSAGSWFAEYSVEGLLRGDSTARAAFYAQGIQWGWLRRNEVRVLENLTPAEGLDEFLTPSNMTLVTVNGQMVPVGDAVDPSLDAEGMNDDVSDPAA